MKQAIGTLLKITLAVAITFLIFRLMSTESDKSNPMLASALDRLGEILRSSAQDEETRSELEKEFSDFSEKAVEGEIPPEKIEEIAAGILNARMQKKEEVEIRLKMLIENLESAQINVQWSDSPEKSKEQLDTLALKIEALTAFQDKHLEELKKFGKTQDVRQITGLPAILAPPAVVDISPDVSVLTPDTLSKKRGDTEVYVIRRSFAPTTSVIVRKNLIMEMDSTVLLMIDSVRAAQLKFDLERLKKVKAFQQSRSNPRSGREVLTPAPATKKKTSDSNESPY